MESTARATARPLGRIVEVDGVRIHYLERGRGAPPVMLRARLGARLSGRNARRGARLFGDLMRHTVSPLIARAPPAAHAHAAFQSAAEDAALIA